MRKNELTGGYEKLLLAQTDRKLKNKIKTHAPVHTALDQLVNAKPLIYKKAHLLAW